MYWRESEYAAICVCVWVGATHHEGVLDVVKQEQSHKKVKVHIQPPNGILSPLQDLPGEKMIMAT